MRKVFDFIQFLLWLYILNVAGASDLNLLEFNEIVIRVMIGFFFIFVIWIIKGKWPVGSSNKTSEDSFAVLK